MKEPVRRLVCKQYEGKHESRPTVRAFVEKR